ncbi:MAG: YdbH domain-containing protein [Proteobacteria bacterium]|nr:YdbH domain-containing protein [Pseudomonadota bacterium]
MSDSGGKENLAEEEVPARRVRLRALPAIGGFIAAVLVAALALVWFQRVWIANRVITAQISSRNLPATYTIESIGTRTQVLTNIVIGDPARPDLTVERAIVKITPQLGLPTLDTVTLIRPRLYGTYKDARASFGSLDRILFQQATPSGGIPDLDLSVVDGRGRLDTDFGVVGIKLEGSGNLRGGFSGVLAAVAPKLAVSGCVMDKASAYGTVKVTSAQPRFAGPLRFDALSCPAQKIAARRGAMELAVRSTERFDGISGTYNLVTGQAAQAANRATQVSAKGDFSFAKGDLTASYRLAAAGLTTGYGAAGELTAEGLARSHDRLARIETEGTLAGSGIRPAPALDQALAALEAAGEGSLHGPVAAQIRTALAREGRDSRLAATYNWRQSGSVGTLVVPRAALRGTSGVDVIALSRVQLTTGTKGGPRFAGNLTTGGAGLPRIEGRIEAQGDGSTLGRFALAEYRAGDSRIAIPHLAVVQRRDGEIGFAGQAALSGMLPGGRADNLVVPVDGSWSQRRGFSAWRKCTPVRFDRFAISNLSLDRHQLVLCPGSEGAILRSDGRGTRFAAGTPSLNLSGKLGTTPIRLGSGAVGFAWPGAVTAAAIDVVLGPPSEPTLLKVANLKGVLGAASSGSFSGTNFKLAKVPLDLSEGQGRWTFRGGDLALDGASFRLEDREVDDRFRPLIARDATLRLHSTRFDIGAVMREPRSDRPVVEAAIVHDLDTGTGHADLLVPGLVFDRKMQPDTLTALALGVIANAEGTVSGTGRVDWNETAITSTGRFTTDGLDFAAAFGPVKGASGTVVFTDLLGLVTAPNQHLKIASINPGIEATDGDVSFKLEPDRLLVVNGATWPFLDGQMQLKPSRMVLGASEVRRFTLHVTGIEAARFIERMGMANLSAHGLFDGDLPLVFDADGGRIEGGMLISRPPGGNVSYVGALTYKDMGAITNFAFQALRSIDYRRMQIAMDGQLEGEIVTRVRFDGVTQGRGAKRNFVTRRFANLPIQFNVNVRAPFQKLVGTFRSLYDTSALRDPRELGLVGKDGKPVSPSVSPSASPAAPTVPNQKTPDIQPSDSRNKP